MSSFGRAAAGAILAMAFWPAAPAHAVALTCGQVITQDVKLTADLENCPGNGVVIGADGVRLDLNGHTISGAGDLNAGWSGVLGLDIDRATVVNGTVRRFSAGINLQNGDRHRVSRTRAITTNAGLMLFRSDRSTLASNYQEGAAAVGLVAGENTNTKITGNRVVDSVTGIRISEGSGNLLTRATAVGSFDGIVVFDETGATVTGNKVQDATHNGFSFSSLDGTNTVTRNVARSSETTPFPGFFVFSANGLTVRGNAAYGYGDGFFSFQNTDLKLIRNTARFNGVGFTDLEGTRTLLEENVAGRGSRTRGTDGNRSTGISVGQGTDVVVRRNLVNANGFVGITLISGTTGLADGNTTNFNTFGMTSTSPDIAYRDNISRFNSDIGIQAADGSTDLGGNHASGNGTFQCSPALSCGP